MSVHSIREAAPGDAVMLHLLAAATFPMAAPGTPAADIAVHVNTHLTVEKFRSHLSDPDKRVYIAETDGNPAGYAMLDLTDRTDPEVLAMLAHSPSVELSKFFLLVSRQGSGLADELMRVVLDDAREHGAVSVWLGVHDDNDRPNRFYDRHQFVRRGLKAFTIGTFVEPDLIREREL